MNDIKIPQRVGAFENFHSPFDALVLNLPQGVGVI